MRLTPMKEAALRAMLRGPLEFGADEGWTSVAGEPGTWNSHSLHWLADRKLVVVYNDTERGGVRRAKIRPAGIAMLSEMECAA